MATVRITEKLVEDVQHKAGNMFGTGPAIEDFFPDGNSIADAIYEKIVEGYKHQIEALPEEFFPLIDCVRVGSAGGHRVGQVMNFSTPKRVPYDYACSPTTPLSAYEISSFRNALGVSINPGAMPELEEAAKTFHDKLSQHIDERRAFVQSVGKLLGNYSTLNPALKEWPPLWDLLPEEVKERHRRVVERKANKPKSAESVELDMDLNKMTSKVVAAKVRG